MTVQDKIYDLIDSKTYSSCDEVRGVDPASEAVFEYVKGLLEQAFNDGKSEGRERATSFEWGIRHKELMFEDWLKEIEE